MAITRPPKPINTAAAQAFIEAAPDATVRKGVKKGKREQISHTLPTDLLARIDEAAEALNMSRAAFINMGVLQLLERGAIIDGRPKKDRATE